MAGEKIEQVKGADLKVGDVIIPWSERRAIITELRPYDGRLQHLFPHGARLAEFSPHGEFVGGMTIDNADLYRRVSP